MWATETDGRPADPGASELSVTLSQSGPRYVSADTEFAVWSATIGEERDGEPVTLVGPLGHLTPGDQLVCTGSFSEHARHGWRFGVTTFRSALPQSPDGIVLWLMTRVPGIGRTFARAIVDHFGAEQVFKELDRDPERLREVRTKAGRAISRKSVERAIVAWREVATIREVETFLFTHGISAGLAARLVRQYGDNVVALLMQDPYRLTELPRIGFKIADRIARSVGIELDDPQRLRAGLLFALEQAEADGHTFLPVDELWAAAAKLLEVGEIEQLESAVRALVLAAEVVLDGDRAYVSELYEMECRLGSHWRSGHARPRSSCSRRRTAPTCRSPTSNGPSSSSCARVRSSCSPGFPAQARRTRSACSSTPHAVHAIACSSALRPERRRGACAI